jgi:hypothetical protein
MAHDHDDDIRPAAEAPGAWTDTMVQAALDAGLAIEAPAGPSVSKALKRAAERIGAWADDPALGKDILKLLEAGAIALDAPLMRATLSPGAELAVSAALMHWPAQRSDELEAIARKPCSLPAPSSASPARHLPPRSTRSTPPHASPIRTDATAPQSSSVPPARPRPTSSPPQPHAHAQAQRSLPAPARLTPR